MKTKRDLESLARSILTDRERWELFTLWSRGDNPRGPEYELPLSPCELARVAELEALARIERRAIPPAILERARERLGVPTFDERGSDRLDFHELHVLTLLDALQLAFDAGRRHGRG